MTKKLVRNPTCLTRCQVCTDHQWHQVSTPMARGSSRSSHHSTMKDFLLAQTRPLNELSKKVSKSGKEHTKEKIRNPDSYNGKYQLFFNILNKIAEPEMENYFQQHGTNVLKWIGITNTQLMHKVKTLVASSQFASGKGTWSEYTEYLNQFLLPQQHEDNLSAYCAHSHS